VQDIEPFLGIFREYHVIKVGFGGTFHMHLEKQIPGTLKYEYYLDLPRPYIMHMVNVESGTNLADILGETATCMKSLHHHDVKDVPSAPNPLAYTSDGLVEELVLSNHSFRIGVDWRPEWVTDQPATTYRYFGHLWRRLVVTDEQK
jgi:putative glutamine amidotransferase